MQLVASHDEIAENLLRFDSYRTSAVLAHRQYFIDRLRLGKIFVVTKQEDRYIFCPSRFAGYSGCTAEKHRAFPHKNGSITTPAITRILGQATDDRKAENQYIQLCQELEVQPSGKHRTYWWIEIDSFKPDIKLQNSDPDFPDEVSTYIEGAGTRVIVNAYERNKEARAACIAHYGSTCVVCGFNFESVYGEIGAKFTHVHHLTPLASVGGSYAVDPITDLRPVCPNCHAMLHRSEPPFSIDELKALITQHKDA